MCDKDYNGESTEQTTPQFGFKRHGFPSGMKMTRKSPKIRKLLRRGRT